MLRRCPRNYKDFLASMGIIAKKNVCRCVSSFWLCRDCVAIESGRFLCRCCVGGLCRFGWPVEKRRSGLLCAIAGPCGRAANPARPHENACRLRRQPSSVCGRQLLDSAWRQGRRRRMRQPSRTAGRGEAPPGHPPPLYEAHLSRRQPVLIAEQFSDVISIDSNLLD